MKFAGKFKGSKPSKLLKNLSKRGVLISSAAVLLLVVATTFAWVKNNQSNNQTNLQTAEQSETGQPLAEDKLFDVTLEQKKDLEDSQPISDAPASSGQTSNNPDRSVQNPPKTTPDYSSLQLNIESINKATVYVNGQPKTVYNVFGQVTYPSGPSSGTVGNGDCTLRLHKLGRGAVGDFTMTEESQGNSYGPTCQFQAPVGRAKLTAGSWVATMTYTTPDGLGKVTGYKGFIVD